MADYQAKYRRDAGGTWALRLYSLRRVGTAVTLDGFRSRKDAEAWLPVGLARLAQAERDMERRAAP